MPKETLEELTGMKVNEEVVETVEKYHEFDGTYLEPIEVVPAVRCNICSKLHRKDSESYFTLVGNIHVGSGGGLLGSGDWSKGVLVSHFCLRDKCLQRYLDSTEIKMYEQE